MRGYKPLQLDAQLFSLSPSWQVIDSCCPGQLTWVVRICLHKLWQRALHYHQDGCFGFLFSITRIHINNTWSFCHVITVFSSYSATEDIFLSNGSQLSYLRFSNELQTVPGQRTQSLPVVFTDSASERSSDRVCIVACCRCQKDSFFFQN